MAQPQHQEKSEQKQHPVSHHEHDGIAEFAGRLSHERMHDGGRGDQDAASATKYVNDKLAAHKLFADSPLVRQGRLSVVPLSAAQYEFLVGE